MSADRAALLEAWLDGSIGPDELKELHGRTYKEVAINVLEDSKDGKTQEQNVSTPVFEGSRIYYRTPAFLYCIGP